MAGFAEAGLPVLPVSTELPRSAQRLLINVLALGFLDPGRVIRTSRSLATLRLAIRDSKPKLLPSRELTAIRSAVIGARLARAARMARIVKFGSEYHLPDNADYVTLDDATILQLWRSYPYEWMERVGERSLRRMIARQAQMLRNARACCVLNRWAAGSVVNDYGVAPSRVHVVGTGPNRQLPQVEREWDSPRFLFVGKDFIRKNGAGVLAAFAEVRRRVPEATLDVVGGHPPLYQEGVTGHGVLRLDDAAEVEALNALYARATCFVLPSLLEPTGNVHAEALAAGIGSIGTTAGGVDTVIGDSGVTVAPDDHAGLIDCMLDFCEPTHARECGARARRRAPLFTWSAVAERVIRALDLPGWDEHDLALFL